MLGIPLPQGTQRCTRERLTGEGHHCSSVTCKIRPLPRVTQRVREDWASYFYRCQVVYWPSQRGSLWPAPSPAPVHWRRVARRLTSPIRPPRRNAAHPLDHQNIERLVLTYHFSWA